MCQKMTRENRNGKVELKVMKVTPGQEVCSCERQPGAFNVRIHDIGDVPAPEAFQRDLQVVVGSADSAEAASGSR